MLHGKGHKSKNAHGSGKHFSGHGSKKNLIKKRNSKRSPNKKKKKNPKAVDSAAPFDELQFQAEDQVMKALRESPQFKAQVSDTKAMLKSQQALVRKRIIKGIIDLGAKKET